MPDPISDSETSLQQIILQGDLPVLSLYAEQYAVKDRLAVAAILSQGKSPTEAIISGLNRYPALCAVYLTSFLAEHFFENESFEVWPKLAMCLEAQDIPQSQRRELWQAFRHACRRLGLPVSGQVAGSSYMVNEFMRQVGLPLQLAPDFVQHVCKAMTQLGLPDPDDAPAVQRWQEALAAYLEGRTTIRILDALRLDRRCHFCRNFLELYLGIRTPACQLEQAMRDALDAPQDGSQPGPIQRTFALPYLVAQEEALGVFLPLQGTWVIEELHPGGDGRPRHLEADVSGQLHLFSNQRCTEVRVRDTEGPRSWVVPVWKEATDNILLFFHADTGSLAARGVLGGEALELDPGPYRVVATFQPTGGAWEPEPGSNRSGRSA